ncbi:prenyltransferase [Elizabethkingia meningoseptica]|uniref:UbiA family prenyltransferase n=1 Tax=Elizabethkingia meningoseptica TaxID=238 RepID=UPI00099A81DF|nr:UbiA family prenyltransferase [Elizabethkingia meningoseptica]OPB98822.1 prenyltransferase [Elizabethkingia meningoseptica]
MKNRLLSRLSVFIGFLLGARAFVTFLLIFALYVSTFFLFNQEESLKSFVFDYKVHGIIFCSFLSIMAGGIINQFYDREKDKITKPFRSRLQSFLEQKYFLYAYLTLNILSLGIAAFISQRVFIFFLVYHFLMWFYSHKLSKILIVNNLSFVGLSLYPFFGMLVYYQTYSRHLMLMSAFLFLILLIIDIIKDLLTINADRIFGYVTIANKYGTKTAKTVAVILLILNIVVSAIIVHGNEVHYLMSWYFCAGMFIQILVVYLLLNKTKFYSFSALNILRLWVFIGILCMLTDGILAYLHYY